jgi:hypothetical protein
VAAADCIANPNSQRSPEWPSDRSGVQKSLRPIPATMTTAPLRPHRLAVVDEVIEPLDESPRVRSGIAIDKQHVQNRGGDTWPA